MISCFGQKNTDLHIDSKTLAERISLTVQLEISGSRDLDNRLKVPSFAFLFVSPWKFSEQTTGQNATGAVGGNKATSSSLTSAILSAIGASIGTSGWEAEKEQQDLGRKPMLWRLRWPLL